MRNTSSSVKQRSSQYLIYLVIISNSQPRKKFLHIEKTQKNFLYQNKYIYIYLYISCSILKKESKLTFENVPTMSWIQSTEISGEPLFSQLLDSFLEIYRDMLQKMARPLLACDF